MKQDLVEKFWKDYYKADFFKRDDLIKKVIMPIFESFIDGTILTIKSKKMREHIFIANLRNYFDDSIDIVYKIGYEKALDDNDILHGRDADKFLKEMKDREKGKISPKQIKFLKECDEIVKKTKIC